MFILGGATTAFEILQHFSLIHRILEQSLKSLAVCEGQLVALQPTYRLDSVGFIELCFKDCFSDGKFKRGKSHK